MSFKKKSLPPISLHICDVVFYVSLMFRPYPGNRNIRVNTQILHFLSIIFSRPRIWRGCLQMDPDVACEDIFTIDNQTDCTTNTTRTTAQN